jgi:hypothetical protein
MDRDTRNLLFNTTQALRRGLEEEFALQLEGTFDIMPDGTVAPTPPSNLSDREQLTRRKIVEAIQHRRATGESDQDSVDAFLREAAFTFLNRLAALKMMEARGIVQECVSACDSHGFNARGFKEFGGLAPGLIDLPDGGYRLYLECLFDEIGREVGILFDRTDPASLLWPRRTALLDALGRINDPKLADIWSEDETIGWIYQYYNDPEERRKMRDVKQGGSAAPRNSREMAVRNQFFTPRYVVEFLTDNALGRLWYEMTKGKTSLKDRCRYLIKRPVELFLPSPETVIWHDADGIDAFRRFSASASPHDLPVDPVLGVLLGWIEKVKFDGFQAELRLIERTHEQVMEEILQPLEKGRESERLPLAHPVELLDVIWRLAYESDKHGYGRLFDPVSADKIAGPVWKTLREKLLHPPENLSKEEQLQQPVFIPHRPIKDPRQIRLIDPACGSMHFGLYAFDLLEIIYQEAWQMGIVPGADFGIDTPAFRHASVRMKPGLQQVHSNDTHTDIDFATARVVMLKTHDIGDGMFHCGPYLAPPDRSYRPGTTWEIPLADFDYQKSLAEKLFTPEEGERFIRETKGCWDHDRADPLTHEEAHAEFIRRIPALILEHNIHGADIDPRAAQIAGLALWLRAQKAWQQQGLRPAERPTVTRSNIVCAEPMPGEEDLLLRFVERSFPSSERPFFTRLLSEIFKTMRLAGEAGSLLKIEDDVSALVAEARAQWKKIGKRDGDFFSQAELVNLDRRTILQQPIDTGTWSLDALSGIPDSQFWEKAEERIYDALRAFAESAEGSYQRRLFADDAARGFAFIDLCRQRYDVALMNPPFGDASLPSKPYLDETYGDTKGDVYKAFVECFQARLVPAGFLGIISSRTGFFLGQSEDWRTRVVLRLFRPLALADLGMGVLDAMVEVAAYVLRSLSESETRDLTHSIVPSLETVVLDKQDRFSLPKWQLAREGLKRHQAISELEHLEAEKFIERCSGDIARYTPLWHAVKSVSPAHEPVFPPLVCIRVLAEPDKETILANAIKGFLPAKTFVCDPSDFFRVPGGTFAYWVGDSILSTFKRLPQLEGGTRHALGGIKTLDDTRFLRAWWEIPSLINKHKNWPPMVKGGAKFSIYGPVPLAVDWRNKGVDISWYGYQRRPREGFGAASRGVEAYFRPGVTWSRRTDGLRFRILPAGCIFSDKGPAVVISDDEHPQLLNLCGILSSSAFASLVGLQLARTELAQSFEVGLIQTTPIPAPDAIDVTRLGSLVSQVWSYLRKKDTSEPTSHAFSKPALFSVSNSNLIDRAGELASRQLSSEETVDRIRTEIDDLAFHHYGLDSADRAVLMSSAATNSPPNADAEQEDTDDDEDAPVSSDSTALTFDMLDYALGAAFGRWDVRFATGEKPAPPEPAPFDPLPICPPGMLQNADGLPATPADVPADYPLRISWPGILVDDKGHDEDIETRVRDVLAVVFPDRVDEIAHEACGILGVKTLREFFRKPATYFAGHLTRYTKSKRKAPIYWPLSSPNGLYTLWLYYPRLTADTLFTALRDFLEPKLQYEEGRAFRLRQDAGPTPAPSQRAEIAEADELVDDLRALRDELKRVAPLFKPDLNDGVILNHAPLWRMIGLPKWRKDCQATWEKLATGDYDWAHLALHLWPERVIPKCATDRSLAIAHDLESTFWEEIPADELPQSKVGRAPKKPAKKKSKAPTDDDTYALGGDDHADDGDQDDNGDNNPTGTGKWRQRKVPPEEVQQLIASRTSPAVKAALEALASAPVSGGAKKKAKKGGKA